MEQDTIPQIDETILVNEVQLILSEKRTALSLMRTGLAVFALPLSVLSVLIATSRLYAIRHVMHFLIPLLLLTIGLIGLGFYLVIVAIRRMKRYDEMILTLKRQHSRLATFID